MNKDERKYVAKRIADEAQLASAQLQLVTPNPAEKFKEQFKNLSRNDAFTLFRLNLPKTPNQVKTKVHREVVTDSINRWNQGVVTTTDLSGGLKFTLRGKRLLEGMVSLETLAAARKKDNQRIMAVHKKINTLKINATDQVLLGSAPEALAALSDFKIAASKLVVK